MPKLNPETLAVKSLKSWNPFYYRLAVFSEINKIIIYKKVSLTSVLGNRCIIEITYPKQPYMFDSLYPLCSIKLFQTLN